MNKKFLKGIGLNKISLALITIITILNVNKGKTLATNLTCEEVNPNDVKYVNVSMWDINAEKYNAKMRGITSDEYYPIDVETRAEIDSNSILFGSTEGRNLGGIQNGYISANRYRTCNGVIQGLANNKLSNGNLVINSTYNNKDTLFPSSNVNTGYDEPYNEEILNYKFPFLKQENGYYSFNSDEYHVKKDDSSKKFILHKGARNGFYPFNNCSDDTFSDENKNLFFTAKFEIPFIMTESGQVINEKTNKTEDMVFNFSGDDDVWIFVDDDLVVDLGGVHIKQTGDINFAKNTVTYSSIYDINNDKDNENVEKIAFNSGKLSKGEHTLRVFYMERAGGESNLFVNFNLQSSGLKVNHIDKSDNQILNEEIIAGMQGKEVQTFEKKFDGYELVEKPSTENYTLTDKLQTVNYYYKYVGKIKVNHIDNKTSKVLKTEEKEGLEGESLHTNDEKFENYELAKKPETEDYIFTKKEIEVNYYYDYVGKIKINHIDNSTKEILKTEESSGKEGTTLKTQAREFDNYVLLKKPDTEEYTYGREEQVINYYYIHQSNVNVNYIVKNTNEKLYEKNEKVNEGTIYVSKEKTFDDYNLIEKPENEKVLIARNDITINYYYELKKFNLRIDMNLTKALINDRQYSLKGNVGKVEAEIKEANSSSKVKIFYDVIVSNTEERKGSGEVTVILPEGYEARQEDNLNWLVSDEKVSMNVNDMEAKESRHFELILYKTSDDDICKTITNRVKIASTKIEETRLDDNEANCDLIIMPRTGINKIIISSSFIIVILAIGVFIVCKTKKNVVL